MSIFTVIAIDTTNDQIDICFDEGGHIPFITYQYKNAVQRKEELSRMNPSWTYAVQALIDQSPENGESAV